jgi:glutathione S-transferase
MAVVLYYMSISHPSQVARKMLELKGVEYERVDVVPFNQRVQLRLAGFRGGTVPALRLDGLRIQGSRRIARALEERWPEPPLYPSDPALRARVEEAERWGEEQLQPVPRRLFRFGIAHNRELQRSIAQTRRVPAPVIRAGAAYFARTVEADGRRATEAGVRADVEALPAMLDHVDQLLTDGTLTLDPPNAAALQVLVSVAVLSRFADTRELVESHASAEPARALFPRYRQEIPSFLDPAWLEPVQVKSADTNN